MARPGSTDIRGTRVLSPSPTALTRARRCRPSPARGSRPSSGVVLRGVGDAVAAAEVDLGQWTPCSSASWACRPTRRRAATSKPAVSKIWLPMWLCRPRRSSTSGRASNRPAASSAWPPARREAELLVLVAGGDELVGVRLDADGHPDHDRRDDAELGGHRGDPVDLVEGVDHDAADPVGRAPRGSRRWSCCCRASRSAPAGNLRAPRDGQLAAGADVEVQALVGDPARDGRAEEGLARVEDVCPRERLEGRREAVAELGCARTEVVFVQDVGSACRTRGRG